MSLINDALQRAKEVQETNPPTSGSSLHFHPVQPQRAIEFQRGFEVLCGVGEESFVPRQDSSRVARATAQQVGLARRRRREYR